MHALRPVARLLPRLARINLARQDGEQLAAEPGQLTQIELELIAGLAVILVEGLRLQQPALGVAVEEAVQQQLTSLAENGGAPLRVVARAAGRRPPPRIRKPTLPNMGTSAWRLQVILEQDAVATAAVVIQRQVQRHRVVRRRLALKPRQRAPGEALRHLLKTAREHVIHCDGVGFLERGAGLARDADLDGRRLEQIVLIVQAKPAARPIDLVLVVLWEIRRSQAEHDRPALAGRLAVHERAAAAAAGRDPHRRRCEARREVVADQEHLDDVAFLAARQGLFWKAAVAGDEAGDVIPARPYIDQQVAFSAGRQSLQGL